MKQRFRDIMVMGAKELLQFDFSARLAPGETLASVVSVAVSVSYGTDASPAGILNGAPYLSTDNLSVMVPVQTLTAGVSGVDYDIKVIAATTNASKSPGCVGTLSVRY